MKNILICLIQLSFISTLTLAQQPSEKRYEFSMQSAAGFSNYKKTFNGPFLGTDMRFPIYRNLGVLSGFTIAHGIGEKSAYRDNFKFINWNLGPQIQLRLFTSTNLQISTGMAISWFSLSEVYRIMESDGVNYPLVGDYSTINLGFYVKTGYTIFVSKSVSLGLTYCITSMSMEKGYMNNIGLACQIGLSK